MKRLPPQKRNQLIMVILATIGVLCLIYIFLIQPQYAKNKEMAENIVNAQVELKGTKDLISKRDSSTTALRTTLQQLSREEEDLAVGDVFSWTYDTLRRFKAKYAVDIPGISQPTMGDVDLMGEIPYKQVKVTLMGTGYYHDIGKFIADFENTFPHIRLVNLAMDAVASSPGTSQEKLNFKMDMIALIKANN